MIETLKDYQAVIYAGIVIFAVATVSVFTFNKVFLFKKNKKKKGDK